MLINMFKYCLAWSKENWCQKSVGNNQAPQNMSAYSSLRTQHQIKQKMLQRSVSYDPYPQKYLLNVSVC